mmetsp:Transcript_30682/g.90941  ORF Transcript_30682/g.90941 Transcript_30682/m.90941 type:complete len:238 (-) Transcript_30682:63-776(-)|eukprot:362772-Chlamydomonas_euryale.AAC.10
MEHQDGDMGEAAGGRHDCSAQGPASRLLPSSRSAPPSRFPCPSRHRCPFDVPCAYRLGVAAAAAAAGRTRSERHDCVYSGPAGSRAPGEGTRMHKVHRPIRAPLPQSHAGTAHWPRRSRLKVVAKCAVLGGRRRPGNAGQRPGRVGFAALPQCMTASVTGRALAPPACHATREDACTAQQRLPPMIHALNASLPPLTADFLTARADAGGGGCERHCIATRAPPCPPCRSLATPHTFN